MSLPTTVLPAPATGLPGHGRTRRDRRRERARLARHDALSAHLAELHAIAVLLAEAAEVVQAGWVQHGWFAYRDDTGRAHVATAHDLHRMGDRPVIGACLVGAVVHAAGGPVSAGGQLVNRALDLTWHTLREDPAARVRWCPSPAERAVQVRDLTGWNDTRGREAHEVTALLHASGDAARVSADQLRSQQLTP